MGINTAEKIFIGMSLENQHPNTDSVVCPLEDIFSVTFPKYNNGNLVDRKPFDMPLLNEPSPSESTEIFDNVTFDDSNNNNYKPCASYHFDIKSSQNNAIRTKDNNQTRALNNNIDFDGQIHADESLHNSDVKDYDDDDDDDLSQFLVFHKKSDSENDPQLKVGCFVKLERIEIPQSAEQAPLDDRRITRSKRKSTNSVSVVLSKDVKQKKIKKEPNASQTKSVSKIKTLCDTPSVPVEEQPRILLPPVPVEDHPRILLHLVRKKFTNEYKIVNRIHPNDQSHAKKKLSKEYVDRPKSQFYTKNNSAVKNHSATKNSCVDSPKSQPHPKNNSAVKNHSAIKNKNHSAIKNSCADRPKSLLHPTKDSANKNHSAIKNICADRPKSLLYPTKDSAVKNHSATKNCCVDRPPKSEFHQKNNSMIQNYSTTDIHSTIRPCCIVIEPLPPFNSSTHRQRVKKKRSTMDHPLDLTISNMTSDQKPRHTNHKSLFDDIESLLVPETNKYQLHEEVKCMEVKSTESVDVVPNETVSNTVNPDIDDNAIDDDNRSISSVLSMDAPSLSYLLDSPSKKDLADANSREADPKKFRIPKINRMTATQAFVENSNFSTVDDDSLDATVTAILRETTTEMPEMISPIKDYDLSSIQSGSKAEEQQTECRKKRVNRFSVENQSVATRRKMNSEDMKKQQSTQRIESNDGSSQSNEPSQNRFSVENQSVATRRKMNSEDMKKQQSTQRIESNDGSSQLNEPVRNIFGVTANSSTSQSQNLYTTHKSSIDWNQLAKGIVMNVSGQSRSLINTSQSTPAAPAETVTSLHLAQNPVAVTLSSPMSPILPPSQIPIQPVPQLHIQPASRLPIYPPPLLSAHVATVPPIHQAIHPPSQLPIHPATGVPIYQANVVPLQTASNQPVQRQSIDFLQPNQNSRSDFNIPLQMNQLSPDKMNRYRTATVTLFERQCVNFLSEKPCSATPTGCPYNHGLPCAEKIFSKMKTFATEKILFIYQTFIVRYRVTFYQYFPMICGLYGSREGTRHTFESFVADCERYEKYDYFQYIFSGQLCGKIDRSNALQLIINSCKPCRASDQAILAIIQDDPQSFIDILIKHAKSLELETLNKLLYQVSTNVNIHQLTACVQLLEVAHEKIVLGIDGSVFKSFCKVVHAYPNLSLKLLQIINRCQPLLK